MSFIVFTLCVISSPIFPSPRVAPRTKIPSLYNKLIARPSIFCSTTYLGLNPSFFILSSNFIISSSLNISPKDNIGIVCSTFLKLDITVDPTL